MRFLIFIAKASNLLHFVKSFPIWRIEKKLQLKGRAISKPALDMFKLFIVQTAIVYNS